MAKTFFDFVYPQGRIIQARRHVSSSGYAVEGILVTRALPAEVSEEEMRLILAGGNRWRAAHPDGYSRAGAPHWDLPAAVAAQVQHVSTRSVWISRRATISRATVAERSC